MVRGPSPGPAPAGPGPGQQLPAHPVQLADLVPPEAAQEGTQEGPQGGRRLDHAADERQRSRRCATRRRRRCSRPQPALTPPASSTLSPVIRPTRGIAQVEALLDQLGKTQVLGQRGGKDQPSIGHQAVVIEGDVDAVGGTAW